MSYNHLLIRVFGGIIALGGVFLQSCDKSDVQFPETDPFETLSEYGLFSGNLADLNPSEGVIPYDLNSTLFTDYSLKQRFIYIPEKSVAQYDANESFTFPNGTILIKNFYYQDDLRQVSGTRKIIETRLLLKQNDEWNAETYLWNDDQTEANRFIAGRSLSVSWIDEGGDTQTALYAVPNKNECKGCHEYNSEVIPIGPKARHLNRDYDYVTGTKNQLQYWMDNGILENVPAISGVEKLPVWDDPSTGTLAERARAYLDINCGYCHNPAGPANNSALDLEYSVTSPSDWGVCKPPIAAGNGSGGREFDIVPGKPDESILVYRMEEDVPDIRMPELGRSIGHDEAILLIRQWISEMDGDCN